VTAGPRNRYTMLCTYLCVIIKCIVQKKPKIPCSNHELLVNQWKTKAQKFDLIFLVSSLVFGNKPFSEISYGSLEVAQSNMSHRQKLLHEHSEARKLKNKTRSRRFKSSLLFYGFYKDTMDKIRSKTTIFVQSFPTLRTV
jgi:hypothetical protein